jgi:endonuclease/exonuclease/phosphatase family metal-dependent hydrolase
MNKITFLSSNIDRYEDLPQRIDKIKQTFANKLYDFYLLQEIYDDKDLKYITPDDYYSLPVSICGNSIISKFKPIKSSVIDLGEVDAISAHYDVRGNIFQVVSTHFAWGTAKEHKRIENAYNLDMELSKTTPFYLNHEKQDIFTIIGGDLNSEPDSATLRFLLGKDIYKGYSTQYIDSFSKDNISKYTSSPKNKYFIRTALNNNFPNPEMLPERRIDYILSRGYNYGRVGSPIKSQILSDDPAYYYSDHYPIEAEIMG